LKDGDQSYTIFFPETVSGSAMMVPGRSPNYAGVHPSPAGEVPGLWGIKKGTWTKLVWWSGQGILAVFGSRRPGMEAR